MGKSDRVKADKKGRVALGLASGTAFQVDEGEDGAITLTPAKRPRSTQQTAPQIVWLLAESEALVLVYASEEGAHCEALAVGAEFLAEGRPHAFRTVYPVAVRP